MVFLICLCRWRADTGFAPITDSATFRTRSGPASLLWPEPLACCHRQRLFVQLRRRAIWKTWDWQHWKWMLTPLGDRRRWREASSTEDETWWSSKSDWKSAAVFIVVISISTTNESAWRTSEAGCVWSGAFCVRNRDRLATELPSLVFVKHDKQCLLQGCCLLGDVAMKGRLEWGRATLAIA